MRRTAPHWDNPERSLLFVSLASQDEQLAAIWIDCDRHSLNKGRCNMADWAAVNGNRGQGDPTLAPFSKVQTGAVGYESILEARIVRDLLFAEKAVPGWGGKPGECHRCRRKKGDCDSDPDQLLS
jgi:hypothetical protein